MSRKEDVQRNMQWIVTGVLRGLESSEHQRIKGRMKFVLDDLYHRGALAEYYFVSVGQSQWKLHFRDPKTHQIDSLIFGWYP